MKMSESSTALQYQAFIDCPQLWLKDQAPFLLFDIPEEKKTALKVTSNSYVVFGKRMETFFSHTIKQSDRFEMIAENLQIISNKTTLGEIDFLIKDLDNDQLIHVELACKFYLYDPKRTGTVLSHWVGPNQNDFLDKKVEKLKSKQMPLLYSEECKTELLKYFTPEEIPTIVQAVCFPANLYLPHQSKIDNLEINPGCIVGSWIGIKDFMQTDFSNSLFNLPEKQSWLLSPATSQAWFSFNEALQQIQQLHSQKKSPLVWVKDESGNYLRMFVVWW